MRRLLVGWLTWSSEKSGASAARNQLGSLFLRHDAGHLVTAHSTPVRRCDTDATACRRVHITWMAHEQWSSVRQALLEHSRGLYAPSSVKSISRSLVDCLRRAMSGLYSGELYQALRASMSGNSMIATR